MGERKLRTLLKPEELAEILGVDVQFVWQEARKGKLPKVPNLGRLVRFDAEIMEKHFNIKIVNL